MNCAIRHTLEPDCISSTGHGISRRSSAASEPDVGLRLASRAGSGTSQHSNHSHRSGRSHHSNVSFQEDVKDDAKEAAPGMHLLNGMSCCPWWMPRAVFPSYGYLRTDPASWCHDEVQGGQSQKCEALS